MIARILFFLTLFLPTQLSAQGFAGLGTDADGFAIPQPDPIFDFPADHGAHPDYRIEWWYLTANLKGLDGTEYGLQWTLFRSALAPGEADGWNSPQVWFAHAAVTTPSAHYSAERFARGGIGQAGVNATPFSAWIDDWVMEGETFDKMILRAASTNFAYEMELIANGPIVFQGQQGYSVKSAEGQASYYYSQPFFQVEGVLQLPGGQVPVTGSAWLDREWSSQPLADNQTGWDWFSLSFETGAKMMGFQLRQTNGDVFTSGTWISADGLAEPLQRRELRAVPLKQSRVANRDIPTSWRIEVPDHSVSVVVEALNPEAWMDLSIPYWEGPVRISGSHTGRGYLEMTGYE